MFGRIESVFCFILTVLFCSCATTTPDSADLSSSEADLKDFDQKDAGELEASPESSGNQGEPEELLGSRESDPSLGKSPEEALTADNRANENNEDDDVTSNDLQDTLSPDATLPEKTSAEEGSSSLDPSDSSLANPADKETPDSSLPSEKSTVPSVESRKADPPSEELKSSSIPQGEEPSLSAEVPSVENDSDSDVDKVISKPSDLSATPEADSFIEPNALGDSTERGFKSSESELSPTPDKVKAEVSLRDLDSKVLLGKEQATADSESDADSENSDDPIVDQVREVHAGQDSGKEDLSSGDDLPQETERELDAGSGDASAELGLSGEDSKSNLEDHLPEATDEPFVGSVGPEQGTSSVRDRDRFRFSSPRTFLRNGARMSNEDDLSLGFSPRRHERQESVSVPAKRYLHLNDWIGKSSGPDSSKEDLYLGSSEPAVEPKLKTYLDESPLVGLSESVPWEYDAIAEALKSRDLPAGERIDKDYDYDSLRKLLSNGDPVWVKGSEPELDQSDIRDYENLLRWLDSRKGLSRPQGTRVLPKRKYSGVLQWLKNEGRQD